MPGTANEHKLLDLLQHLWPYISGAFITIIAAFKLWWSDRHETKKRIVNNERAIAALLTKKADIDQLKECREDVRKVDDKNLELVFKKLERIENRIEAEARSNSEQHQEILKVIR